MSRHPLLERWEQLAQEDDRSAAFSRELARVIPFTAVLGARVLELDAGHAVVAMPEDASVQNHLGSVHAGALCTLGDLTGSLAFLAGLPPDARALQVGLELQLQDTPRGGLTARCDCPEPVLPLQAEAPCLVHDERGILVARVVTRWQAAPP